MIVTDLFTHCERTIWRNVRSRATLKTNLKILRRLVGHEPLTALHFTRLETLVTELEALGGRDGPVAAPATVKRRMETLSAALTHHRSRYARRGWRSSRPSGHRLPHP